MPSRGSSSAVALCSWVALCAACAPTYRPPAPFVPMHEAQGDSQLSVYLGTGGGQANFGYALTNALAVRGSAQLAGGQTGSYAIAGVGADVYGASQSLRYGLALEGSSGPSVGISDITISNSQGTGSADLRFSGTVFNGRVLPYFGVEVNGFGINLSVANVYTVVQHNAQSDGEGTGIIGLVEPNLVIRAGARQVAFELFAGLAIPYLAEGDNGIPVPINLGAGLTFQLTRGDEAE
ncbi:MAG: hypothetical protein KTR31_06510 [Myxococcales bacterium]|nr:hypothetical protein [Myxococcales bacterium]